MLKMDKKNKFEKPELEIVKFEGDLATDDIVTTSGEFGNTGGDAGDINKSKGWW